MKQFSCKTENSRNPQKLWSSKKGALQYVVTTNAIQKHPWCKKSEAKSKAPVTSIFCMRLKDVISGRGQGLLRFNQFVYAAIYNHVQTNRNNACRQTLET